MLPMFLRLFLSLSFACGDLSAEDPPSSGAGDPARDQQPCLQRLDPLPRPTGLSRNQGPSSAPVSIRPTLRHHCATQQQEAPLQAASIKALQIGHLRLSWPPLAPARCVPFLPESPCQEERAAPTGPAQRRDVPAPPNVRFLPQPWLSSRAGPCFRPLSPVPGRHVDCNQAPMEARGGAPSVRKGGLPCSTRERSRPAR